MKEFNAAAARALVDKKESTEQNTMFSIMRILMDIRTRSFLGEEEIYIAQLDDAVITELRNRNFEVSKNGNGPHIIKW